MHLPEPEQLAEQREVALARPTHRRQVAAYWEVVRWEEAPWAGAADWQLSPRRDLAPLPLFRAVKTLGAPP